MDGDYKREPLPGPVDFCKLSPFQRQTQRDAYRAKPKTTFSYSSLWAQPKRGCAAELITKCSPHTEMLAMPRQPLPKMHFFTRAEREAQKELEEDMTKEELKWLRRKPIPAYVSVVKKGVLTAKCSPRLDAIAMAKLKPLLLNKRMFYDKLPAVQKKAIVRHIKENLDDFKMRYPPESEKMYDIVNGVVVHVACNDRAVASEGDMRQKYICELNKNQRKIFRKRMKALSVPRLRLPPSTGPERGPKKRIKEFEPWLTLISQPRFNLLQEIQYNPFEVKKSAKNYVPTERILNMAKPRLPPQPPPLLDYEGNEVPPRREWSFESRRRIVASPRTIELATPRFVKKKAAEDTKEDPFAVPRRALTAFCTQRTKELAEPRKR